MEKISIGCGRVWLAGAVKLMLAFIIAGVLQDCSSGRENGAVILSGKGNLQFIVTPDHPDQVVQFAASELKNYLKKITGIQLQIVEASVAGSKKGTIQLVVENSGAQKWDGYRIEIGRNRIRLLASESRGLLYAAYDLLEESGCSFFYPGEKEEIVPRKPEIVYREDTIVCNPVLEHRGLAPYGLYRGSVDMGRNFIDWMAKNRLNYILVSEDRPSDSDGPAHGSIWEEVHQELLPELQKRGFVIEMSEHCAPVFFPRALFKEHPDWFALNNGERKLGPPPYSGQMCYSNRDAVEFYANAIAGYAARHPEFHLIGTWPLDGGGYCECENCRDPETVFKAAMRVAEKVRQVRPDMIVEHLAYKVQTWQPPDMPKIPDNMSVLWCPDAGDKDSLVHEWIGKAKDAGGVYQFEYYMGDNYRTRANVWLRPGYAAGVAYHAGEMGFRGVISLFLPIQNWWRASFNNWFFARACWDKKLDVKVNLRKYCTDYYGPQAMDIEAVFDRILNDLQKEPYKDQRSSGVERLSGVRTISADILEQLDHILKNTKAPEVAVRIQRIRTYVEYSLIHCEAMASKKPADLKRLSDYSQNHPDQQMVIMYPEYIRWRNAD
jgi:hypothetical protein